MSLGSGATRGPWTPLLSVQLVISSRVKAPPNRGYAPILYGEPQNALLVGDIQAN